MPGHDGGLWGLGYVSDAFSRLLQRHQLLWRDDRHVVGSAAAAAAAAGVGGEGGLDCSEGQWDTTWSAGTCAGETGGFQRRRPNVPGGYKMTKDGGRGQAAQQAALACGHDWACGGGFFCLAWLATGTPLNPLAGGGCARRTAYVSSRGQMAHQKRRAEPWPAHQALEPS